MLNYANSLLLHSPYWILALSNSDTFPQKIWAQASVTSIDKWMETLRGVIGLNRKIRNEI